MKSFSCINYQLCFSSDIVHETPGPTLWPFFSLVLGTERAGRTDYAECTECADWGGHGRLLGCLVLTVVEQYTKNVRFCIICNYVNKIIPAIQSRCTRFRFSPLSPEQIENRLDHVITEEKYVPILLHSSLGDTISPSASASSLLSPTHPSFLAHSFYQPAHPFPRMIMSSFDPAHSKGPH